MVLGPFPGSTGRSPTELVNEIDPATGVITYVVFTTGDSAGPDGDGMLAFVDLQARALGETALDLKDVELTDIGGNPQDASGGDGLAIVASPPNLAEVSILKSADPATVTAQGALTYTLQRTFSRTGQHAYNEIAFDPLPGNTTYLADSATLTFTHTFVTTGSHDIAIAVWNCAMPKPEAAIGAEPVTVLALAEDFWIYLPVVMNKH